MDLPYKYKIFENISTDTLDIVLNGMDFDMSSAFIQSVVEVCKTAGNSVISFNYPFQDRKEDHSSGPELSEEKETIQKLLTMAKWERYKNIRLVGKSLGAIVAGEFLKTIPEDKQKEFTLIVLGYPTKYMDLKSIFCDIHIIQGEKDKNGGISEVKKHLVGAKSTNISYYEVKNADHSFRDPDTKESVYEKEALKILSSIK